MSRPLPPFQVFFDDHWDLVVRFTRAFVGAADAEDCAQDAMLAALRAYPRFDGVNPRGWLLAIARNKTIDHHRANGKGELPLAELPDPGRIDRRLGAIAEADALRRATANLSEVQRSAVVLRHVLDLPYSEIAPALGCTDAAARQRVREALGNLRSTLDEIEIATTGGSR